MVNYINKFDQEMTETCNTVMSKVSFDGRCPIWCFTLNNPTKNEFDQMTKAFSLSEKYIFQKEIGDEEKVPHFQGVVKWKTKKSLFQMKKIGVRIHWERCRNFIGSVLYCSKPKGRIDGPWANFTFEKKKTEDKWITSDMLMYLTYVETMNEQCPRHYIMSYALWKTRDAMSDRQKNKLF